MVGLNRSSLGHGRNHTLQDMHSLMTNNQYQSRGKMMANLAQRQVNNYNGMPCDNYQ